AVAATGALAAVFFMIAARFEDNAALPSPSMSQARWLRNPIKLLMILAALTIVNAAFYPYGLRLAFVKTSLEENGDIDFLRWNSFSRVMVRKPLVESPHMWGASEKTPQITLSQRHMNIDGSAGTTMYRFSGNLEDIDFFKYDI